MLQLIVTNIVWNSCNKIRGTFIGFQQWISLVFVNEVNIDQKIYCKLVIKQVIMQKKLNKKRIDKNAIWKHYELQFLATNVWFFWCTL